MPRRTLAIAVVSFALGSVVTVVALYTFSVPGRAVQHLQRQNRILRELVNTLEQERDEVQAILRSDVDSTNTR